MNQAAQNVMLHHSYERRHRVLALLMGVVLAAVFLVISGIGTSSAGAQGRVSVVGAGGANTANASGAGTLAVTGSGFQSVAGGFGGVYVFFGWTSNSTGDSWRPSKGGTSGHDFQYIADSETKDNQGYQRFVAFPGSDTASSANGGVLSAEGAFSLNLNIPGPVIDVTDRTGASRSIDCRTETCGVLTVGAHGVVNANNETFTPITFSEGDASAKSQSKGATGSNSKNRQAGGSAGEEVSEDEPELAAGVGIDHDTAVVGRVLSFAGRGFQPGEQLVATLDAGAAAVGPLTAGPSGEVAGVLQLPSDIRPGTHTLKLAGIASEQEPEIEFAIVKDPTARNSAVKPEEEESSPLGAYFAVGAAVIFVAALTWTLVIGFKARAARKRETENLISSNEETS